MAWSVRTLLDASGCAPPHSYNKTLLHHTQISNFIKLILPEVRSQNQHDTLMVGDFSTIYLPIDWSPGQKLNKEIFGLNEIINQRDPSNI